MMREAILKRNRSANWLLWTVLAIGALIMLFPILVMASMSFKHQEEIYAKGFRLIPRVFTLQNYVTGWQEGGFGRYFLNSTYIAVIRVFVTVIINAMAGFAFAKYQFKGKNVFFLLILSAMMIPDQIRMIPLYTMMNGLGLLDTHLSVILPALGPTFGTFLMRQYAQTLPDEILEAARIDGCPEVKTFFVIVLPLCLPAVVTNIIFQFMWSWNDFLYPLLFLREERNYTVQLALSIYRKSDTVTTGPIMAMSLLSVVPILVIFFSLQKYFVEGIATQGVKG